MEPLGAVLAFCLPMSDPPSAEAVVDAYIAAYNAHDARGMARVMSAKAVVLSGDGEPLTGKAVVTAIDQNIFGKGSEVRFQVVSRVAAGDMVAQVERYPASDLQEDTLSAYRVAKGCIVEMHFSN